MKSKGLLVAMCIALAAGAQAVSVSYSGSAAQDVPGSVDVNVRQFDSSLGTLTGVTLSLVTASMSGSLNLNNAHAATESWDVTLNNGYIVFSGGSAMTQVTWDNTPGTPGTSFVSVQTVNPSGTTVVSPSMPSGNSTQNYGALANFINYGAPPAYMTGMTVQFFGSWGVDGLGGGDGFDVNTFSGSADWQVTYTYDLVPEPTSLGLIALGAMALGLRRRFKKTV